jgi:hypothetical protein
VFAAHEGVGGATTSCGQGTGPAGFKDLAVEASETCAAAAAEAAAAVAETREYAEYEKAVHRFVGDWNVSNPHWLGC